MKFGTNPSSTHDANIRTIICVDTIAMAGPAAFAEEIARFKHKTPTTCSVEPKAPRIK